LNCNEEHSVARSDKLLHLVQDGVLTDGEAAAALVLRACADRPFAGMVSAYQQRVDYSSRPGEAAVNHWHSRQQLRGALGHLNSGLGTGDVLIVAEWDRATRSMMDGVHLIERINKRGSLLKVLDKPNLDLTTPIGRGFIAFLSALAEDERQRIVKRANDGRTAAKARGANSGASLS
jgi:DNA invertase Pin-like site-specific DNA recombinase